MNRRRNRSPSKTSKVQSVTATFKTASSVKVPVIVLLCGLRDGTIARVKLGISTDRECFGMEIEGASSTYIVGMCSFALSVPGLTQDTTWSWQTPGYGTVLVVS